MTKQEFMLTLKVSTHKMRLPKKRAEDNVTEVPREPEHYLNGGFTLEGQHAYNICQYLKLS